MFEDGRRTGADCESCSTPARRSSGTTSLRGGIRDGAPGLIVSLLNSYYVVMKFVKLWELEEASQ